MAESWQQIDTRNFKLPFEVILEKYNPRKKEWRPTNAKVQISIVGKDRYKFKPNLEISDQKIEFYNGTSNSWLYEPNMGKNLSLLASHKFLETERDPLEAVIVVRGVGNDTKNPFKAREVSEKYENFRIHEVA